MHYAAPFNYTNLASTHLFFRHSLSCALGSFKFGGCKELVESSWRERIDSLSEGVLRTRPRIDTVILSKFWRLPCVGDPAFGRFRNILTRKKSREFSKLVVEIVDA